MQLQGKEHAQAGSTFLTSTAINGRHLLVSRSHANRTRCPDTLIPPPTCRNLGRGGDRPLMSCAICMPLTTGQPILLSLACLGRENIAVSSVSIHEEYTGLFIAKHLQLRMKKNLRRPLKLKVFFLRYL